MLVLTRKVGQSIRIGDDVRITVIKTSGQEVRLGLEGPRGLPIYREEIYRRIQGEGGRRTVSN